MGLAVGAGGQWYRSRHVSAPLNSSVVAIDANGERFAVLPTDPPVTLLPGSRVAATSAPSSLRLAEEQRTWVASGRIPGPAAYREMASTALLDIHTLLLANGAAVAAWAPHWRYVWPRDAAMVAVALARTGHRQDALSVLQFLQRSLGADGIFQARYRPDGSGPPDDRGEQSDGIGWALWASATLVDDLPPQERADVVADLGPLIRSCTGAALRLTEAPDAMPPASPDYWEVRDERLSLGTAAPMAFALEAASALATTAQDPELAGTTADRAARLRSSIREQFGRDAYPRYLGDDQPDAAVAFLLPPFTKTAAPDVLAAWARAGDAMKRPAGGLAPGAGWKEDGISWTPQTALFALTAAATSDPAARGSAATAGPATRGSAATATSGPAASGGVASARARLDWISDHRTPYGAIPEKVLHNGEPAGPAPLAWSAALVLLTLDALET